MMQLAQFLTANATSAKTPMWSLSINGANMSAELSQRIIRLTLTDNPGFEADTISISLDDADGRLAIPAKGAKVSLQIGWADEGLIDKGDYIIDNIAHRGAPDVLEISGKSADFKESLLERRSISYKKQTIGSLINKIAGKHGLSSKVDPSLAGKTVVHKVQSNESDINFITRLADEHDAIAQIKNSKLIFIPAGGTQSASGQHLPQVTLRRQDGDQHSYNVAEREKITGVKAHWRDVRKAKKEWEMAGSKGKVTSLKKQFPNKESAKSAAEAELKRLKRGVAKFSLRLAFAMPQLIPKTPIVAAGFKSAIDTTSWKVLTATHTLDSAGFVTVVSCEQQ